MTPVTRQAGEQCWAIYGLTLTSPHPFANRLTATEADPDLWVRPVDASPIGEAWTSIAPSFRSPVMIDPVQSFLDVVQAPTATVFHFADVVDFFVLPDGIAYRLFDEAYAYMVELHLLGVVLAYWLERKGVPALHASAVVIDDHAVGFLSSHGGGKTSVAAALVLAGFPLLTDDVLPVSVHASGVLGQPGYPQMRMWPDQARHFVGHDAFDRIHPRLNKRRVPVGIDGFGRFATAAHRLTALYVPERREDEAEVHIDRLRAGPALFELVHHSFLARIVEGLGLAPGRFATFAEVVRRVPVRSLRYPSGFDVLPEVVQHVAADARSLRGALASVPFTHRQK